MIYHYYLINKTFDQKCKTMFGGELNRERERERGSIYIQWRIQGGKGGNNPIFIFTGGGEG